MQVLAALSALPTSRSIIRLFFDTTHTHTHTHTHIHIPHTHTHTPHTHTHTHSRAHIHACLHFNGRDHLKCDGTRPETRFRLSAKRTSPFKSAGASVESTTGSRGVRISGSNAGYTMFRGSVKGTGYPLHSPVSPFTSPPCVTLTHHISTGV